MCAGTRAEHPVKRTTASDAPAAEISKPWRFGSLSGAAPQEHFPGARAPGQPRATGRSPDFRRDLRPGAPTDVALPFDVPGADASAGLAPA